MYCPCNYQLKELVSCVINVLVRTLCTQFKKNMNNITKHCSPTIPNSCETTIKEVKQMVHSALFQNNNWM